MGLHVAVEITGWDLNEIFHDAAKLGVVGIVGAGIGLLLGAGVASLIEDRGWGDPSKVLFYWAASAACGVFLLVVLAS